MAELDARRQEMKCQTERARHTSQKNKEISSSHSSSYLDKDLFDSEDDEFVILESDSHVKYNRGEIHQGCADSTSNDQPHIAF